MKDQDALQQLGELAQSQEADVDPRLDALCRGELPSEELAALEKEAETDDTLRLQLELFRPLEPAAQDRIAERVVAKPNVVSIAEKRPLWQKAALLMAPLAAAAAVVFWLSRPAPIVALPGYSIAAHGEQQIRSGSPAAGPVVVSPDSTLTVVLRPDTTVEGNVTVRFFVERQGALEALSVQAEPSAGGSLRLRAPARDVFGAQTGDVTLVAIIGRPAAIEADPQALVRGGPDRGPGWQRVAIPVKLLPEQ